MHDDTYDLERENRFNKAMHAWEALPDHLDALQAAIGSQTAAVDDGGGHKNRGTSPGSRAPWNQGAANAYFDIHAEIRRVESALTIELHQRAVYRGGSDDATRSLLKQLPIHLRALHARDADSPVLREALHALKRLTGRAHLTLNPAERRIRAPYISCHVCEGDTWIYREGHRINAKITSDHFQPGDAYCNRCAVFYPRDIWEKVAKENAPVS